MLEDIKKKVVSVAKKACESGLCLDGSGNFSIKDEETGYIAITPTKLPRAEMTYHDIIIIDSEGNIVENKTGLKPTSETMMHLEAYKTREDINAVVHTHSMYATSFAICSEEIKGVVFEALAYGGKVPLAKYGRPGTSELAKSIIEPLKISDAVLMEKHGALLVDKDIDVALTKATYLEEVAQMYYHSLAIKSFLKSDRPLEAIPEEEFKAWKYPESMKK
ncbi:class II aldolase/adducin family protein [Clostridiaceae bacterium M8S5]|nr:class II aldolase/adducin family protein [Clostridiaceae bacterium M8S5]